MPDLPRLGWLPWLKKTVKQGIKVGLLFLEHARHLKKHPWCRWSATALSVEGVFSC